MVDHQVSALARAARALEKSVQDVAVSVRIAMLASEVVEETERRRSSFEASPLPPDWIIDAAQRFAFFISADKAEKIGKAAAPPPRKRGSGEGQRAPSREERIVRAISVVTQARHEASTILQIQRMLKSDKPRTAGRLRDPAAARALAEFDMDLQMRDGLGLAMQATLGYTRDPSEGDVEAAVNAAHAAFFRLPPRDV